MRVWRKVASVAVVLAVAAVARSRAQSSAARASADPAIFCSRSVAGPAQEEILREIDDPNNGDRWLLLRDRMAHGGPGRLVQVAGDWPLPNSKLSQTAMKGAGVAIPIRAGDRLIVEEHTAVADAVLDARALGPAAVGSKLKVRLAAGGKVVSAVALGPGRAALQPETGVWP